MVGVPEEPPSTGRRLVGYAYPYPSDRWRGWDPGDGMTRVSGEIAETLADIGDARRLAARAIEAVNADSLRKRGIVAHNAVWVPDRTTGEVAAVMDFTIIGTSGGDRAPETHLARNVRKDLGWTTRIVDYAASISEVPAGRMTIEQVLLRRFTERRVQAYLFLNVFPPGACEAASLVFNTVQLDLVPELARQARMIAESLELTLGEIPGGRRRP